MASICQNGDLYAPPITELKSLAFNRNQAKAIERLIQNIGLSRDAFPGFVADELYFQCKVRLFGPRREAIDLETVDIEDSFGEDAGRWVRQYVTRASSDAVYVLQKRCIPRVMWIDFALTSRAARLGPSS